jgi:hypothetical protein
VFFRVKVVDVADNSMPIMISYNPSSLPSRTGIPGGATGNVNVARKPLEPPAIPPQSYSPPQGCNLTLTRAR